MTEQEKKVYHFLDQLNIPFKKHNHPPAYTVEQANLYWADISGMHCKNLFLRNKKGRCHYLLVAPSDKQLDMKKLYKILGERVSFASEARMQKYLGVSPGSVSPFGLINDENQEVIVLLDEDLFGADQLSFHPNINTVTMTISRNGFDKYLSACGNEVRKIQL